ncbi:hypothetical protein BLA17378_04483 [Burkholderia aenigmatica]|uniref:Glycosyltransferase 2-like domain-containing protein n=2 Tax=Burkholderia aenigmatica TaxID=2015348 RepID=A0ABY6XVP3_9BURK|nr:hypothetical protein BLA17378_04483 [Burkholderia aenigmatica]
MREVVPDITVTIVFHCEGSYVVPALGSMKRLVEITRDAGIVVETRALLDKANDETRHLVSLRGAWLDDICEVSFGDLGLTRNYGAQIASGRFLSFLDGDDLWGSEWLTKAFLCAVENPTSIWHPEVLFFFNESDYDHHIHSMTILPSRQAQSHFMRHKSSTDEDFDKNSIFLENPWSANVFAAREIHLSHPYKAVDKSSGNGFEDWSWNHETFAAGIHHCVTYDTVHLIRQKDHGSLGRSLASEGFLPFIPHGLFPTLG